MLGSTALRKTMTKTTTTTNRYNAKGAIIQLATKSLILNKTYSTFLDKTYFKKSPIPLTLNYLISMTTACK